ncbi:hypothetical protein CRPA11_14490 [Pseudomonas aeruginosa]
MQMLPLPAAGAGATGDTTMPSTQHQLIKQCATRLRGIVEALDNIHDSTPHRWSTDLDDVHSSAESLLALIKDQAPARSETSFEEWLANELEGEDGQPVPAAVCDITLARRAFNHWPKLEQPAKVGGVRFSAGVSSRLVVEAAQRLYEFESTPEKEAERIEQLQAFREQLDPLNLAPHAEAFNEAPAEVLKPEQAERPEVVGVRYEDGTILSAEDCGIALEVCARVQTPLMTVAQHERIVEARWNRAMDLLLDHVSRISEKFKAERDAALARVEQQECTISGMNEAHAKLAGLYEAAQAQHSVPESVRAWFEAKQAHVNAVDAYNARLKFVREHCPFGTSVDPEYQLMEEADRLARGLVGPMFDELRSLLAAAPGKEVPQAWLDVQSERRRQINVEGWTPEHDDKHETGALASAAGCYAMFSLAYPAGDPSHFWPWDKSWWKPSPDGRRNMVKAGALILAEIERLDRAAASQGGPSDA